MIYGTLEHRDRYANLSPLIMRGLEFLKETDFEGLEPGRIEIDGDQIYALIQEYETKEENAMPEAHRQYADIQYLIEGEEYIGVAPLEEMSEEVEAHPERDIWFYHGKTDLVKIGGEKYALLFPEDAHAPCIAVDRPTRVKKCVVKVKAG